MKMNIRLKGRNWKGKVLILSMALFMVTCVEFENGIDGPETAKAGETVTFTVHPFINNPAQGRDNVKLVIGFLAPKSWNSVDNTTVAYTSDIDDGIQTMSLMPKNTLVEYSEDVGGGSKLNWWDLLDALWGVGPNVSNEMEWVVYQTDKSYTTAANQDIHGDVKISIKLGQQNLRAKLGFFIGETADGIWLGQDHYAVQYTDCFQVTDGVGAIVDFCELHLNAAAPTSGTQNDIITLIYQGDVLENELQGADEVYLCATAHTDAGNTYTVCDHTDKTKMEKPLDFAQSFEISIWPKGYFSIPDGEEITEIDYTFTNKDGTIEVRSDLSDEDDTTWGPFTYTIVCN